MGKLLPGFIFMGMGKKRVGKPKKGLRDCGYRITNNHRVSIERKSPYKESYTVNSHRKSFDDVMGDVRACLRIQISR